MSVEIGQMVVQASVAKDAEGKEGGQAAAGFDAVELESLKKDVLDACRRMIAESLRDRRER